MPHRGYLTQRSPSYGSSHRSPPVYSPKGKGVMGLSPLALRVVARTVDTTQLYHGCGSDRAAMLNWTSLRAFERGYVAEAPIRVIPRIGSAYKPKGYSSHPPNPLKHLISFLSGRPLSLPLIEMSRGQRQQSGPPVTSVPALSSHQLVRLPTR